MVKFCLVPQWNIYPEPSVLILGAISTKAIINAWTPQEVCTAMAKHGPQLNRTLIAPFLRPLVYCQSLLKDNLCSVEEE